MQCYVMECCAMQEVTEYMFDHDVLNIRRAELLHHRWTDRVYDPIRNHVLSEMSGKDYQNLLLYKRFLYEEFLAKSNRKVFFMIVIIVPIVSRQSFSYHCQPVSFTNQSVTYRLQLSSVGVH